MYLTLHRMGQRIKDYFYRRQLLSGRVSLLSVWLSGGMYWEYRCLRKMYRLMEGGKKDPDAWRKENAEVFWGKYWYIQWRFQPWLAAQFHRTLGLTDKDPFCVQPESHRMWLARDCMECDIPCTMLWEWLAATEGKDHPLEHAFLLSTYPYSVISEALSALVKKDELSPKDGYFFASMVVAMGFRMADEEYASAFAMEANDWKMMYARWEPQTRLYLLRVLSSFSGANSQEYTYAWAPELFPEAAHLLDIARATQMHPATVIRKWYEERNDSPAEVFSLEGLI